MTIHTLTPFVFGRHLLRDFLRAAAGLDLHSRWLAARARTVRQLNATVETLEACGQQEEVPLHLRHGEECVQELEQKSVTPEKQSQRRRVKLAERPLDVPVRCGKSHHCIWGTQVTHLGNVPAKPRRVLEEICRVEALIELRIGRFARGGRQGRCRVALKASKTPGIIEGELRDPRGTLGQRQFFQLRFSDYERTEDARRTLAEHLNRMGLLVHG